MVSFSLDYIFNCVYDVLLWIKYVFLFVLLRKSEQQYLIDHQSRVWDGLRDRGWLDDAQAALNGTAPVGGVPEIHLSFFDKVLQYFGWKLADSDRDGIPDIRDSSPNDPSNVSASQLKERFEGDYSFWDKFRSWFGFGPEDSDGDGVPDSYEEKHGMNAHDRDTDHDGLFDGEELRVGTNPLDNDTDKDRIIDGRDDDPLNPYVTSTSADSDGDGVSDIQENRLGTNIHSPDTDGDGIPDGSDSYPTDPNNISESHFNITDPTQGLSFHIQNPVLGFIADLYSVLALFALVFFAYSLFRWFIAFWYAQNEYEEHFGEESYGHSKHVAQEKGADQSASTVEAYPLIPGLPTGDMESASPVVAAPTLVDFENHPRWAIVEGYMASDTEALWRIGILEADNMLADILRERGYAGADVGEMLQSAGFRSLQLAWDAHKVRNRIAHEGMNFTLTEREARRTFALYEAVFREMKVIG
jgi:hypothetical protein